MKFARALRPACSGFTLIEMVISSAIMAIILTSAYLCLNACFASQKLMEPRLEAVQNARVALAILGADLRGACPLSKDYDFLGVHRMAGEMETDSIDFATHNYTPRRPREGDYCQESFYVDKDPETGQLCLYRRRNPILAFDALSGGSREEIARGLRGLRFEYYDGLDWYDDWGDQTQKKQQNSNRTRSNLSGMPEAVRITLWLDPHSNQKPAEPSVTESKADENAEPPMVFQTVARLNLRGSSQGGSSGGSSTNSAPDTGGQSMPGGPGGPGGGGN